MICLRKSVSGIVIITIWLALLSTQIAPITALSDGKPHYGISQNTKSETITSIQGIRYEITFNQNDLTVDIIGVNTRKTKVSKTGFVTTIDDYRLSSERNLSFEIGERKSWRLDVTNGINVMKSSHTIVISTFGDSTQFNFTKQVNSSSPGSIPTPYIQDIKVTNGTIDGEPSAVAKVTVANPSIHPYSLKLMVHTLGTAGSFYGASVSPGENRTITVELLDERESQIAGEARPYAGNLSRGDGGMDQVEFVGRAGEDTRTWNESYEPIKGPWRSDGYEYHNETFENDESLAERLSRGYEIFGVPIAYAVPFLVVGVVLLRRFR